MSSDNGVYIAKFANGEYRVGYGFDSSVEELESPNVPRTQKALIVKDIWDQTSVYKDPTEAHNAALELCDRIGYTEYGICEVEFEFNFGDLPPETKWEIMDISCKECSSWPNQVIHGEGLMCPHDPANIGRELVEVLRNECTGIHEYKVARVICDFLKEKGLIKDYTL